MGTVAPRFTALAVAQPVRPFVETSGTGRILASFDRSCYLETAEGQLVAALAEPLGRGAFALTVRGTPPFATLHPEDTVTVEPGLLVTGEIRIDLTQAALWDPAIPALAEPGDEGIAALRDFLRTNAPEEGLSRALFDTVDTGNSALLAQGRRALARLRVGLDGADAAALTEGAGLLAGLGPGLTPSGDDVLAGILLALRVWPERAGPLGPRIASALLVGTAAPRTGRISRAYLWAARQGHAADSWHDLIRALPGPAGVAAPASRILETGETSGADMLAGFLFGGMR